MQQPFFTLLVGTWSRFQVTNVSLRWQAILNYDGFFRQRQMNWTLGHLLRLLSWMLGTRRIVLEWNWTREGWNKVWKNHRGASFVGKVNRLQTWIEFSTTESLEDIRKKYLSAEEIKRDNEFKNLFSGTFFLSFFLSPIGIFSKWRMWQFQQRTAWSMWS